MTIPRRIALNLTHKLYTNPAKGAGAALPGARRRGLSWRTLWRGVFSDPRRAPPSELRQPPFAACSDNVGQFCQARINYSSVRLLVPYKNEELEQQITAIWTTLREIRKSGETIKKSNRRSKEISAAIAEEARLLANYHRSISGIVDDYDNNSGGE